MNRGRLSRVDGKRTPSYKGAPRSKKVRHVSLLTRKCNASYTRWSPTCFVGPTL